MTTRVDTDVVTADHALENKHRALWALGDYTTVATELMSPLGPVLVQAAGIGPGDRVLDVAAGAGNVAIPAALAGANVVASDLLPELLKRGAALAQAQGVNLQWCEANAEALPFDGDEFDAVLSCVGVMFAAMKPYMAAPSSGVLPPPKWGNADYLRGPLRGGICDFTAHRSALTVDRFADGAAFRDFFKTHYGPTISAYRGIAGDPERAAALDAELAELGDRCLAGSSTMEWEYLLVTARKR